ncbi:hypothetical protein G352_00572 [Rhodococcus ruber BKS 20-38]|uniref:Uncharacterized protein n=1 Tax=Rhodococcus ruber BKS 20-38 TaxID=1278076 RepID=M3A362_9NOCA|nr:hypothetical protein G352_00572 [Rhodococcus ruber BKS 20-38]
MQRSARFDTQNSEQPGEPVVRVDDCIDQSVLESCFGGMGRSTGQFARHLFDHARPTEAQHRRAFGRTDI